MARGGEALVEIGTSRNRDTGHEVVLNITFSGSGRNKITTTTAYCVGGRVVTAPRSRADDRRADDRRACIAERVHASRSLGKPSRRCNPTVPRVVCESLDFFFVFFFSPPFFSTAPWGVLIAGRRKAFRNHGVLLATGNYPGDT